MKANAPEKIYAYIPDDDIVGTASTKKGVPHQFVTEEYTRTDAFIEKVYNWLRNYAFVEDNQNINLPTLLHDFLKDSRSF